MSFVDPRTLLGKYGLKPKKSFGQNFLVAGPTVEKIARTCVGSSRSHVVEIGAGLGTLTSALLDQGATVIAIERDRELLPVLRAELADAIEGKQLELVEADAATVDLRALLAKGEGDKVLAGNLPYQITGRLIELATTLGTDIARAVFMVQREVADRLIAKPNGDAYGQLTVFVQAAFEVERAFLVSSGSFHPRPEVESAIVVLRPRAKRRAEETESFRKVVHHAFGARRKTLKNALAPLMSSDAIKTAVAATGIDLKRRGETLDVEEYDRLARAIQHAGSSPAISSG